MLISVFILAVVFSVIFGIGAAAGHLKLAWPALSFAALAALVATVGALT